jgi:hypothetical protein
MNDPWVVSIAALALFGSLPGHIKAWRGLLLRKRSEGQAEEPITESEFQELRNIFLGAQADWLFHKLILLNLVVAFSREHQIPDRLVEYCQAALNDTRSELEEIQQITAGGSEST